MVETALSSRLDHLLETRWHPRLSLTSSERDNLFRWDGSGNDHFETYVVQAQLPGEQAAIWLRHELRLGNGHRISPRLRVLAIFFDHRTGLHRSFSEEFPLTELDFSRKRFGLRMGSCELSHAGARGSLAGGALRWDLAWEPRRVSARPLVWEPLYGLDALPSKMLIPNDAVPTWGRVEIEGRQLKVEGSRAQQSHLWGRQSPRRWMATHVDAFEGRPDCRLEAYQVQDRIGGRISPWLMSVRVTYRHRTYFFPRILSDLARGHAEHRADGWSFSCGRSSLHFRGRVQLRPADLVGVRIQDPDGRELLVATAATASAQVEVLRRGGLRFHREALLSARHRAWYELASSEPDAELNEEL